MKKSQQLQEYSNFVIFQTETGKVNIEVFFQNDTLWLTQKKIVKPGSGVNIQYYLDETG